jgi:hypothetical protein
LEYGCVFPKEADLFDCLIVFALGLTLVAEEKLDEFAFVCFGLEGEGVASAVVHASESGGIFAEILGDSKVEGAGLDMPAAAFAPFADGKLFDVVFFEDVGRLDGGAVTFAEGVHLGLIFGAEAEGVRGETMFVGIAGRATLPFGSFGASGFGAVGPGGFEFSQRRHILTPGTW